MANEVDIQIEEISMIVNKQIPGNLENAIFDLKFKPEAVEGQVQNLVIRWDVVMNIGDNIYVEHSSKTTFRCKGISFTLETMLYEPLLDIFAELASTALSHTRMYFMIENPQFDKYILMMPHQYLKRDVKKQITALLN